VNEKVIEIFINHQLNKDKIYLRKDLKMATIVADKRVVVDDDELAAGGATKTILVTVRRC